MRKLKQKLQARVSESLRFLLANCGFLLAPQENNQVTLGGFPELGATMAPKPQEPFGPPQALFFTER